ncbi:ATP-dependent helicase HrpB [Hypericibacter adhaerens]|uniref:ATP-dependent helicase HrpB n=3 Tax=Hypericibacter adhaerens TaxID=2602016 RepID=A0A5J6N3R4_9PROT|nr:ATP-dependent helicase HrpB [Hypericibacter adhaerens]QEX24548.1 ATP-dependent helicase HrpB [Hypericibacter adhaerens]
MIKLPIEDALPALKETLARSSSAVLVAPPGAGKTTRVPPALLDEPWVQGRKILVLEPRRLAARAAAHRIAQERGEAVGGTVGFRVRLQSQVGPRTRIEFLTEGLFARRILADPGLEGVAAVLFDEFHERSLDADLGMALALDAQRLLREDLRILAMSATLDGARVAALLGDGKTDAPLIRSEGRLFEIETRYRGRERHQPIEPQVAETVLKALDAERGGILVFLPGAREIRRVERLLAERLKDPDVILAPLYGAMEGGEQDRAIAPAPRGKRKIVLATSIAETSLTIEGVRVVVDSGLARVPRYDPAKGLTELATVRVSRAAADQRRGRAGRTEPGICYRLWDEAETRALEPFPRPEILETDLAALALTLAEWGTADPGDLAWLDPPPKAGFAAARELLLGLDALDAQGRITTHGKALARLPLPPRLAHMVRAAAEQGEGTLAAEIALLLTERGLGGTDSDLRHRLSLFARDRSERARDARRLAEGWQRLASPEAARLDLERPRDPARAGALLALAYPDRVAQARPGKRGEYLLANGRGGRLEATDSLASEPYLAVAEIAGEAAASRVVLAAPIAEAEIEKDFAAHIEMRELIEFDPATRSVKARRLRRFGQIVLSETRIERPDGESVAQALIEGLRGLGLGALPWSEGHQQWRARVAFLRAQETAPGSEAWPDLSDATLLATLEDWLGPFLAGQRSLNEIDGSLLSHALEGMLTPEQQRRLKRFAPTHLTLPTGRDAVIDYGADGGPTLSVKLQELFGLAQHPSLVEGRVPITLALLSPAGRPVQVTRDLPGFWRGSYKAVRAEMRGRYPKHPWPEDPLTAPPTARAKRPGSAG